MSESPVERAQRLRKEKGEQRQSQGGAGAAPTDAKTDAKGDFVPASNAGVLLGSDGLFVPHPEATSPTPPQQIEDEVRVYFDVLREHLVQEGLWEQLLKNPASLVGDEWQELGLSPPSPEVLQAVCALVKAEVESAQSVTVPEPPPFLETFLDVSSDPETEGDESIGGEQPPDSGEPTLYDGGGNTVPLPTVPEEKTDSKPESEATPEEIQAAKEKAEKQLNRLIAAGKKEEVLQKPEKWATQKDPLVRKAFLKLVNNMKAGEPPPDVSPTPHPESETPANDTTPASAETTKTQNYPKKELSSNAIGPKPPTKDEINGKRESCLRHLTEGSGDLAVQILRELEDIGVDIRRDPNYVKAVQTGYRKLVFLGNLKDKAEQFKKLFGEGVFLKYIDSEFAVTTAKPNTDIPPALVTVTPASNPKEGMDENGVDDKEIKTHGLGMKRLTLVFFIVFLVLIAVLMFFRMAAVDAESQQQTTVPTTVSNPEKPKEAEKPKEVPPPKVQFSATKRIADSRYVKRMAEVWRSSGLSGKLMFPAEILAEETLRACYLLFFHEMGKRGIDPTPDFTEEDLLNNTGWWDFLRNQAQLYPPLYLELGKSLKKGVYRWLILDPLLLENVIESQNGFSSREAFMIFAEYAVSALEEMERGKTDSSYAKVFAAMEAECMSPNAQEQYRVPQCVRKMLVYDNTRPNAKEEDKKGILWRGLELVYWYEAAAKIADGYDGSMAVEEEEEDDPSVRIYKVRSHRLLKRLKKLKSANTSK